MDRKEIIRKYKETPQPTGVYRIYNKTNRRSLVGTSQNLPGTLNRERFQLEHGSHPDRELQDDWAKLGCDAFTFEVLDELEPAGKSESDIEADVHVLLQMWLDKLRKSGEQLYRMSEKIR